MMELLIPLQFYFSFIISYFVSGLYSLYKEYIYFFNSTPNKIQDINKREIVDTYYKVYPVVLKNLLIYSLPCCLGFYYIMPDNIFIIEDFFTLYTFYNIILLRIFTEIFFYIFHKIFHFKLFYKYHKIHHRIKSPIGISAIYAHPLDLYFGNIFPIFLPCLLFYTNIITIHLWIFITTWNTINISHSGFDKISNFHDNHHKYFKCNFGTGLFMDKLLGTEII